MAQSKVTDYYTRRKHSASLQPTKRTTRNSKILLDEHTPAKVARKAAILPETLPVKTAALGGGAGAFASDLRLSNNNVDLTSQLRSFNQSKSSPRNDFVSDVLSRTFSKTTNKTKVTNDLVGSDIHESKIQPSQTPRVSERTPAKRLASDPDKSEPPRRKRCKIAVPDESNVTQDNIITKTPTPSRTKKASAVKVRRRLDHDGGNAVKKVEANAKPKASSSRSQKQLQEQGSGNINVTEMREKLAGCGKLADLQARLALVKDTAAEVKKLQQKALKEVKVKEKQKFVKVEKPEAPSGVPAFERYRHLIQQGPSKLPLPFKYRSLEDAFRCSDTVVSMLHNRTETCTFSKLKYGVQEMSRKTFDLSHLKQIKTVYPTAYDLSWTKTLPHLRKEQEKKEPYTLLVEANLAGIPTEPEDSKDAEPASCNLLKGLTQPSVSQSGSAMFDKFTPSMLIARRTLFHNGLIDIVKSHHQEYLSKLNPAIPPIPDEKLQRWHPKFPLEKIPEVTQADIPMPQKVATFDTARDVLNKARDMMINPKVAKALELVAKNSELKAAVEAKRAEESGKKTTACQPKKPNQALKGVSQDLLNRIKAKEAQKTALAMMRTPEAESRIGMLERLPELCRILRVFFLAEKKAALPIDMVIEKLIDSYRSALSKDDVEKHLNLMVEVLPDWLKKVHIRKDCYIKIDRTKELAVINRKLEAELKEAKKLK